MIISLRREGGIILASRGGAYRERSRFYWRDWAGELVRDGLFKLTHPTPIHDDVENISLGELINQEARTWNVDVIMQYYDLTSANAILAIPLSHKHDEDILFWGHTKHGFYTVRSGYWLGMLGTSQGHGLNSLGTNRKVWNRVWNLNGPPKLKHFLWRACKNSLHVNDVRFYRHMTAFLVCSTCNVENETVCHAIFDCQQSSMMWQNHPAVGLVQVAPRNSFADCFEWLCEKVDKETITMICASTWGCWFGRSRIIMENKPCDFSHHSSSFVKLLQEYNDYASKVWFGQITTPATRSWNPPLRGWIKANFDGHLDGSSRRRLGAVFRDHEGKVLVAVVRVLRANLGVEETEAATTCYALEVAHRMGYEKIILEGDAQIVINTIKRKAVTAQN